MTARIQRTFDFMSGVYFGSEFYANYYEFDVTFTVESESIYEQNVAMDRIKYFIMECLQHSIFVEGTDQKAIEKLADSHLRVCVLPEEPYDQVIGIMLLAKLNAITEGRLIATDIAITSKLGDDVTCFHSIEETYGPFALKGWWNEDTPKISNKNYGKNKKIVKLSKHLSEWSEVGLEWEPKKSNQKVESEVVFAKFDTKTDK